MVLRVINVARYNAYVQFLIKFVVFVDHTDRLKKKKEKPVILLIASGAFRRHRTQ